MTVFGAFIAGFFVAFIVIVIALFWNEIKNDPEKDHKSHPVFMTNNGKEAPIKEPQYFADIHIQKDKKYMVYRQ